jgi:hypothetical protein
MPDVLGITMDIPHRAREDLTHDQKLRTGFAYGVSSSLLPLVDTSTFRTPPGSLDQAREEARQTFPVFFSAMDRSVARSLSPGVDVGSTCRQL